MMHMLSLIGTDALKVLDGKKKVTSQSLLSAIISEFISSGSKTSLCKGLQCAYVQAYSQ